MQESKMFCNIYVNVQENTRQSCCGIPQTPKVCWVTFPSDTYKDKANFVTLFYLNTLSAESNKCCRNLCTKVFLSINLYNSKYIKINFLCNKQNTNNQR